MTLLAIDRVLDAWIAGHRLGLLSAAMWAVTVAGEGGVVWLVASACLTLAGRLSRKDFVTIALAILVASLLANRVLKPLIHRTRPDEASPPTIVIGSRPDDASFPSGHAAVAGAAAAVLTARIRRAWPVWWGLAFAIAYSRVYLGVHYPLDVVAGLAIGAACGFCVLRGAATLP